MMLSKREKTILAIQQAAKQAFYEKSYSETNVDEIATLAQCSKGTVYNYFGGKEQLFLTVLETLFQEMCEKARLPRFDSSLSPKELLEQAIMHGQRFFLEGSPSKLFRLLLIDGQCVPRTRRERFLRDWLCFQSELLALFDKLEREKGYAISNKEKAAEHLHNLCQGDFFLKQTISIPFLLSEKQLEQMRDESLALFLAAYGPV
jgi:AcrR family transcriptional regulator